MKPQLQARQTQTLALTPQLRQALAVLQMSAMELDAELAEQVETNPLLEWAEDAVEPEPVDGIGEGERAAQDAVDDWQADDVRDEWREAGDDWSMSQGTGAGGGDDDVLARHAADRDLREHLAWQLGLTRLSPRDMQIGLALIDGIDDDGYLREDFAAIREALPAEWSLDDEDILPVLHLIQQLDPPGCGGRDLGECLCLQLQLLPADTPGRELASRICGEAIERLPRLGTEGIAREMQVSPEDAAIAIDLLRGLDPRPGAQIGSVAHDSYVVPDVVVWRQHGLWRATLASHAQPRVTINSHYAAMAADAGGEDGHYLRGRLQEARWLLKNIQQRGETLLRVTEYLIREQAAFLEFGPQALRPLTLRQVASKLELHESTISRAIARKYMRTPRGTLALRDFFASGISGEGGEASSTAIQSMIRDLVEAENPRKPLSDAALARQLEAGGVAVARRTVAKYREALGIPSSQERVRL